GGDQGLLERPIPVTQIHLLPAERADILVDFSRAAGRRVRLLNDTRDVAEWRVAAGTSSGASLPTVLRPIARIAPSAAVRTRTHVLSEDDDMYKNAMRMLINRTRWHAPVTETPTLGTTEIWELVNVTDDAHPIHLHLVRFQILERQPFDAFTYRNGRGLRLTG